MPTWISASNSLANLGNADRVTLRKDSGGQFWIHLHYGAEAVLVDMYVVTSDAVTAWNGLWKLMVDGPDGVFVCQPHGAGWAAVGDGPATEEILRDMEPE